MTLPEYEQFADDLARSARVENGIHGYFLTHRTRLWQTASHFNLWNQHHKRILEVGPFFSYTPFILAKQGNEVQVMEGDDPAVYPLRPLYEERGIPITICDLLESFGAADARKHALPFEDNQFDLISCWETMEHFNFNPVGFVRELNRILKPGGEAFITVPNMANLTNRVKLIFGRSIGAPVESYSQFYNYAGGRFLGFHWREYVMSELTYLFRTQNFSIVSARHLLTFHNHPSLSAPVKIRRLLLKPAYFLAPSLGNLCAIVARKPLKN